MSCKCGKLIYTVVCHLTMGYILRNVSGDFVVVIRECTYTNLGFLGRENNFPSSRFLAETSL